MIVARWERKDIGEVHILEEDGRLVRYSRVQKPPTYSRRHGRLVKKVVSRFSRRFMDAHTHDELVQIVQNTLGESHVRKLPNLNGQGEEVTT